MRQKDLQYSTEEVMGLYFDDIFYKVGVLKTVGPSSSFSKRVVSWPSCFVKSEEVI
jgi:hypothetical protein